MTSNTKLKPCPFCPEGGAPLARSYPDGAFDGRIYYVECDRCHARARHSTSAAVAATEWNTRRAPHPAYERRLTPEQRAALIEALHSAHHGGESRVGNLIADLESCERTLAARLADLTFADLRAANLARLPVFKDGKGRLCHPLIDGQPPGFDWSLSQWSNAVLGELGEAANLIKKIERGDFTLDEMREELGRELADVQTYLDVLAHRAGVDLGAATVAKWNEVSVRVGCDLRIRALESARALLALETLAMIDELRADEGNSVEVLCTNPDFNNQPDENVEVVAAWTDWEPRRFGGATLHAALTLAVAEARRAPSSAQALRTKDGKAS